MMYRAIVATAVTLSLAPAAFAAPAIDLDPLIGPAELEEIRTGADPLILDIRGEAYAEGHIPGAVHAPYPSFRGPADNPGQLLTDRQFTELFRSLGITYDRPTVVVHQGTDETDFGAAARVYWTLKSAGVSEIAILNGGMNAWTGDESRDVTTEATIPQPSEVAVTFSDDWLATREDVLAVVEGKDEAKLLDARPEAFWAGEESHQAAARPGTLPQSEYFAHSGWFDSGPAIVDASAARDLAERNGFTDSAPLISFCNTGHWAATNWFALSELAGLENVKLYPESMVGWSNAGLPMENVPGLLRNLWSSVSDAF
jgi:thiosulfate/3-mercaptopyruvate sulfurtransferase